jgi:hypothetical protein
MRGSRWASLRDPPWAGFQPGHDGQAEMSLRAFSWFSWFKSLPSGETTCDCS